MKNVVIFGGSGFIGTHLAQHMLRLNLVDKIFVADLAFLRNEPYTQLLQQAYRDDRVRFIKCDVTEPIPASKFPQEVDLIVNLAAIHREPGHLAEEYFRTNISGAENVTAYANSIGCDRILFTSSISPYGPTEQAKNEESQPAPETPYGSSKLAAEKIHIEWQESSPRHRLVILRPGVVFGPGEGGNVSRLIRSLVKGYFVYTGNRDTRKAGGYVKELCCVVQFVLDYQAQTGEPFVLLNFSADPPPSMEKYVESISRVVGIQRQPISLPRWLLMAASHFIHTIARPLRIKQPFNPIRVRKLFRSTNIDPKGLRRLGYKYQFTLDQAFEDWMSDSPSDFVRN